MPARRSTGRNGGSRRLLAAIGATGIAIAVVGISSPAQAADGNVGVSVMPASSDFFGGAGKPDWVAPAATIEVYDADGDGSSPVMTTPAETQGLFGETQWLTLPDGRYKVRTVVDGYLPAWAGLVQDGGPDALDQFAGIVPAFYDLHPTVTFATAPVLEVEADDESTDRPAHVVSLASRSAAFIGGIVITADDSLDGGAQVDLFRVGSATPLMSQATVEGTYVFDDVPNGKFQLRFTQDGVEQWWPFEDDRSRAAVLAMDGTGGRAALDAHFGVPDPEATPGEFLTISGDPVEGGVLSLVLDAPLPFDSADLLGSEVLSGIQWWRDGVALPGEHGRSLTVPQGAAGGTITATARFTQLLGYFDRSVSTPPVGPVAASTLLPLAPTPVPTISGTSQVGVPLRATVGTWGPGATTKAIQWNADGAPIAGATAASYTPKGADAGSQLTVTVTASKPGYQVTSRTSAPTAPVAEAAFAKAPVPAVKGTLRLGSPPLTVATGTWGPAPVVLTYQWVRNGQPIDDATAATYSLTADDVGASLAVRVTGQKLGYLTAMRESAPTASILAGRITNTVLPSISGTPRVGQELAAAPGSWTPPEVDLQYEWLRAGVPIPGAVGATYTPVAADVNAAIKVRVTASLPGYTSVVKTSAATAKVRP